MPTFTAEVPLDIPRSQSNEPGELRFHLRRLKADNPGLHLLGADGAEVGVGIEWWTRREHRFVAVNTTLRLLVRHLKACAFISQGCEPILLESRFRPLGNDYPHLLFTIRY